MSAIVPLLIPKKKQRAENIGDTLRIINELFSMLVDIKQLEDRIIALEKSSSIQYPVYINEIKLRKLTNNALQLLEKVWKIHEALMKPVNRQKYVENPKIRKNYNKIIWREIKELNWFYDKFAGDLLEAAEEFRMGAQPPELKSLLVMQATKLSTIVSNLKFLRSLMAKEM